jgi:type III secretion protein R
MAATYLRINIASAVLVSVLLTCSLAIAQTDRNCTGSPALGSFIALGALVLVPLVFIAATSFVKLSVVLSILRNALGIGQAPSEAVLAVLAAVLTFYVMAPVGRQMMDVSSAAAAGIDVDNLTSRGSLEAAIKAFNAGKVPLGNFLKHNAGDREIALFVSLGQRTQGQNRAVNPSANDLVVVLPAFLLTELKEAFQIGFLVYIPFLVIDMVVANLLLAMGMQMISPATVSLPFKLLIFVLVDGWYLLAKALVLGYKM